MKFVEPEWRPFSSYLHSVEGRRGVEQASLGYFLPRKTFSILVSSEVRRSWGRWYSLYLACSVVMRQLQFGLDGHHHAHSMSKVYTNEQLDILELSLNPCHTYHTCLPHFHMDAFPESGFARFSLLGNAGFILLTKMRRTDTA